MITKLIHNLLNPDRAKIVIFFFIILSIGMMCFSTIYQSETLISHPQHGLHDQLSNELKSINNISTAATTSYNWFFYLDYLWPICLLILIGKLYKSIIRHVSISKNQLSGNQNLEKHFDRCILIWSIVASTALALDWTENTYYLNEVGNHLSLISKLKILLYAITIVMPIISFHLHSKHGLFWHIGEYIRTSYLSLIVIGIIGLIMTQLSQGVTIMIDILSTPANLIGSFILLNYLALLISHYPIYLFFRTNKEAQSTYKFFLSDKKKFGIGLITFRRMGIGRGVPNWIKVGWHTLGVVLLVTWSSAICYTLSSSFIPHFNVWYFFFLTLLISFLYYSYRREEKENLSHLIWNYNDDNSAFIKLKNSIFNFNLPFFIGLLCLIIIGFILLIYIKQFGWGKYVNLAALGISLLNIFVFIEFRLSRSFLKYFIYSEKNKKSFTYGEFNNRYFEENQSKTNFILQPIVRLSDNLYYLAFFRFLGGLTIVYFIAANCLIMHAHELFNPLNILTAFLIIIYSLIIIYNKHSAYYKKHYKKDETSESAIQAYRMTTRWIPITLVLITVASSVIRNNSDNISTFESIDEGPQLSLDEYLYDFKNKNPHKDSLIVSIASDGGGLKANVWNMLVLRDKFSSNKKYFDNVLSLSGVSGGALGIGNTLPLLFHDTIYNHSVIDSKIDKIGESNVLAIDFVGVFIRDWFLSHFSFFKNRDRSYFAMKTYEKNLGLPNLDSTSFRNYWYNLYKKSDNRIPLLNINSTSTTYKQGYAFSVSHEPKFPSSVDILSFYDQGKSISYYNAVSTSNRFPIASPAAKINGKGYFVDGGYFENSGLLASEHIKNLSNNILLKNNIDSMQYNHMTINIRNGKSDWARLFVKKFILEYSPNKPLLKKIKSTQDNAAILLALVSLDKHPEVLREELERNERISYIAMPHILTLEDIKAEVGGEVNISIELIQAIKNNNQKVRETLKHYKGYYYNKWGVVTPPLARLLTKPVVEYQRAMVNDNYYLPEF